MTNEMVERVARAIWAERQRDLDDRYPKLSPLEDYDDPSGVAHINNIIGEARAAIAAMREPTEKMLDAGSDEDKVGYAPDGVPAVDVWIAMIDAALENHAVSDE